jgi:hypothetical protein
MARPGPKEVTQPTLRNCCFFHSQLAEGPIWTYFSKMTAVEIIEAIKGLPREEQTQVAEFARHIQSATQLSPEELGRLAQRMVDATDPAEADRLEQEIIRGFYGSQSHA